MICHCFQTIGQIGDSSANPYLVNKGYPGNPVPVFDSATTLLVILPSAEIPTDLSGSFRVPHKEY